jgi:CheY-like chemotaxis protein
MDHQKQQLAGPDRPASDLGLPADAALVLIVDDERSIATTVADVVEDLGYRVRVAAHGREALDLARGAWPALVITDLVMPQLNGAGLIAALCQEAVTQERAHVPVILMTAAGMESARKAGADAMLRKPFDLEELEHLVTQFLPHSRGATR